MIVKDMPMPKARNAARGPNRSGDLNIPFGDMVVGDAYKASFDGCESLKPYNLLKQRVFRASVKGKKFATRMIDGVAWVFRTA